MSAEFAAMMKGVHPDEVQYRAYVLAELRCARTRALLLIKEIETIGVALRGGMIDGDVALTWLADANALDFLLPTEPVWQRPDDTATTPIQGTAP